MSFSEDIPSTGTIKLAGVRKEELPADKEHTREDLFQSMAAKAIISSSIASPALQENLQSLTFSWTIGGGKTTSVTSVKPLVENQRSWSYSSTFRRPMASFSTLGGHSQGYSAPWVVGKDGKTTATSTTYVPKLSLLRELPAPTVSNEVSLISKVGPPLLQTRPSSSSAPNLVSATNSGVVDPIVRTRSSASAISKPQVTSMSSNAPPIMWDSCYD